MKIRVPKYIQLISNAFKDFGGYDLFLVGGCVRDAVLGKQPKDWDVATNALPDKIIEILSIVSPKWKLNLQGKKFGIIAVYGQGLPRVGVEIATFRSDMTTGRNPEVKIGVKIDDDVLRRDITWNALFYDIQKDKLVDLVGGLKDLDARIVRMVGNPKERIDDDNLRIIRVIRFAANLEFDIEKETKEAIKNTKVLVGVSMERVWDEFSKVKNVKRFFELMFELNVFELCFPKLTLNKKYICEPGKNVDEFLVNITGLLQLNTLSTNVLTRIKLDKDTSRRINFLVNFLKFDPKNVYNIWTNFRNIVISNETLLEWCKMNSIYYPNLVDTCKKFIKFKPVHNSDELMSLGFKEKALGDKIKSIEEFNFLNIK